MQKHFPKGNVLTALEKNVLKARLFEMGLILFYIEELKRDTLASVQATHPGLLPNGTKNIYTKMWDHLVGKGVITQKESDEIQEFIDYRNDIAHKIYTLTAEVSRDPHVIEMSTRHHGKYKNDAVKKIEMYRDKIERAMMGKYVHVLSLNAALFQSARKTYKEEINKLNKKIKNGIKASRHEYQRIKAELDLVPADFYEGYRRWEVTKSNGNVSSYGKKIIQDLKRLGIGPMALAYITRMSYKSMKRQIQNI